jgi:hypothetical protein
MDACPEPYAVIVPWAIRARQHRSDAGCRQIAVPSVILDSNESAVLSMPNSSDNFSCPEAMKLLSRLTGHTSLARSFQALPDAFFLEPSVLARHSL